MELASGQHCYNLGTTQLAKHIAPDNTMLCPVTFASKSLTGTEHRYSNIECEALAILLGLEKFHHYCFRREVLIMTDHKPLVSMFKKDCGHIITMHTMHTTKNPPIQGPDHIQTWPRDFHCRLAVET